MDKISRELLNEAEQWLEALRTSHSSSIITVPVTMLLNRIRAHLASADIEQNHVQLLREALYKISAGGGTTPGEYNGADCARIAREALLPRSEQK